MKTMAMNGDGANNGFLILPGFYKHSLHWSQNKYLDMKHLITLLFIILVCLSVNSTLHSQPKFKAVVLTERGGNHESFVVAALDWLGNYSKEANFEYIVINKPDTISEAFLSNYKLFIQLNYPPYRWPDKSKAAFEDYIDNGKGAWIGFHHA